MSETLSANRDPSDQEPPTANTIGSGAPNPHDTVNGDAGVIIKDIQWWQEQGVDTSDTSKAPE